MHTRALSSSGHPGWTCRVACRLSSPEEFAAFQLAIMASTSHPLFAHCRKKKTTVFSAGDVTRPSWMYPRTCTCALHCTIAPQSLIFACNSESATSTPESQGDG